MALPFELLEEILDLVTDIEALYNLCFVNSIFLHLAQRGLYHSIKPNGLVKVVLLCHVLLRQPALARIVYSLELTPCGDSLPLHRRRPFSPSSTRLLFRTMLCMPHLKRLIFPVRSHLWDPANLNTIPNGIEVLHLDLHCEGIRSKIALLTYHPSLRELAFVRWRGTFDVRCLYTISRFPRDALSQLSTLDAPLQVATRLVPHRPVKRLCVDEYIHPYMLGAIFRVLAQSSGPLQSLRLQMRHINADVWICLAKHFPELVEFELLGDQFEGATAIETIDTPLALSAFGTLPHFRTLKIRTDVFTSLCKLTHEPFLLRLWGACPTLEEVLFEGKTGDQLGICGTVRYTKEVRERGLGIVWHKQHSFVKRW